jgi:hypothetical protein
VTVTVVCAAAAFLLAQCGPAGLLMDISHSPPWPRGRFKLCGDIYWERRARREQGVATWLGASAP